MYSFQLLDREGRCLLSYALGDTPEIVLSSHLLQRGRCQACVAGGPSHLSGAIVQSDDFPSEPTAFGSNPAGRGAAARVGARVERRGAQWRFAAGGCQAGVRRGVAVNLRDPRP